VQARYPGEYTPIEEEEYEEAVRIATYVCRWVEESIKKTKK
jgi:HEPN domain-containing protein